MIAKSILKISKLKAKTLSLLYQFGHLMMIDTISIFFLEGSLFACLFCCGFSPQFFQFFFSFLVLHPIPLLLLGWFVTKIKKKKSLAYISILSWTLRVNFYFFQNSSKFQSSCKIYRFYKSTNVTNMTMPFTKITHDT